MTGRDTWKGLGCWMEEVGRAEVCCLVSPVTKFAEESDALIGSRVSELFHPGSSRSRSAPLPPLGVLASGSQTAKFIASCLLGQMKMEVEVPLRVGCVVQTFVELWVLLLV